MLGWGGGRGRGLRSRNDFYMCGVVGGYGTKKCFCVAVWEREDFVFYFLNTQPDMCESDTPWGPAGFCGGRSTMTVRVRPRHSDAFILPQSLSSVFSGIR